MGQWHSLEPTVEALPRVRNVTCYPVCNLAPLHIVEAIARNYSLTSHHPGEHSLKATITDSTSDRYIRNCLTIRNQGSNNLLVWRQDAVNLSGERNRIWVRQKILTIWKL